MAKQTPQIIREWLCRDPELGFVYATALEEVERLLACDTERDYLKFKRNGAKVALNRVKRKNIWGLYQNAQKHAAFGEWLKENA